MKISQIVANELELDASSVWRLKSHEEFGYSDGSGSERYLQKVFASSKDLSFRSTELETHIKDWPSEYHLSSKRAQLLSGFKYDRALRVLEVGCGCGAITRFLGETFDEVISVEGSIHRARLARARTRDLDTVSIVCSPFQKLRFAQKFDIIFCIGVFEYSAAFIDGADPYEAAAQYFSEILSPDGILVIAIENQFGLKYFNGAREDHLDTPFEGLEGYHRNPTVAKTFGKVELEQRLSSYFPCVQFFYPFPDYKMPDCVLSREFVASGRAGELVSQMPSSDYSGRAFHLWNEPASALELNKNRMLEFFSNSFLIVAGKGSLSRIQFEPLGILFSSGRKKPFKTETRVLAGTDGILRTDKRRIHPQESGDQRLTLLETSSPWREGLSVFTEVRQRSLSRKLSLKEIFEPCLAWKQRMLQDARLEHGIHWLPGSHIDSIWPNAYTQGGQCEFIDREWIWHADVRFNSVVIRAIYDFLIKAEASGEDLPSMRDWSGKRLIRRIASAIGVELAEADFSDFLELEGNLAEIVSGASPSKRRFLIRWLLLNRPSRRAVRLYAPRVQNLCARVVAKLANRF